MTAIRRINHVQITISPDQEAEARHWYCEVMGLTEIPKPDSLVARGGFWVELAGQQIHIGVQAGQDRHTRKDHIAYEVEDVSYWRDHLMKHGAEILESIPIPGYERFECRDPFGNRLEIIQPMKEDEV